MTALRALETKHTAMHRWLLQGDPSLAARVLATPDDAARTQARLRIYADGYRLRLLDVLGNDFPVTRAVLGRDAFEALAIDYLHAHPSTQPSVRHVGHAFADWVATRTGVPPAAHGLARFEWLQGEVFDAADAMPLTIEDVAALPADQWPALRLHLHPALRLLQVDCNAGELLAAHAREASLPELERRPSTDWLLWRTDGDVHWRHPDADEAAALRAVSSGRTFGELCEALNVLHGDAGALRAAGLLKRWLADGLLAAP